MTLLDQVALPVDPDKTAAVLRLDLHGTVLIGVNDDALGWPSVAEILRRGHPLRAAFRRLPPGAIAPVRVWVLAGLSESTLREVAERPDPLGALVRSGALSENTIYARAAAPRGLRFLRDLEELSLSGRPPRPTAVAGLAAARFRDPDGRTITVIAPALDRLHETTRMLARNRSASETVITTPRMFRSVIERALGDTVAEEAGSRLIREDAQLSASTCPTVAETSLIAAQAATVAAGAVVAPQATLVAVSAATCGAFVALAWLRIAAVMAPPQPVQPPPLTDGELPNYTVLVALYREENMVAELLWHLGRLDYPLDRLEILLLVEQDDGPTRLAARRAASPMPHCRVVTVPPGTPRTKPRALNYGLAFARGEVVTVYDAEDRPAADQLRIAASALVNGPESLACVQARLRIDHVRNPLQAQFAIEYAALFDGLLPWLGRIGAPLPLGGTSNHFKRHALLAAHAWDPFNVTEDADLGIRMMRYGFKTDVIDSVTFEVAPHTLERWHRQRVRWLKGWIVTWLVHSRRPRQLFKETGRSNALLFHGLSAANVVAPLCHPIGLALPVLYLAGIIDHPFGHGLIADMIANAALIAFAAGNAAAVLLARRALVRTGRRDLLGSTWLMPAYWLLSSFAAAMAVVQLVRAPHYWAKTPHEPVGTAETTRPVAVGKAS